MRASSSLSTKFVVRMKIWPSALLTPSKPLRRPLKVRGQFEWSALRSLPKKASMSSKTMSAFFGALCMQLVKASSVN